MWAGPRHLLALFPSEQLPQLWRCLEEGVSFSPTQWGCFSPHEVVPPRRGSFDSTKGNRNQLALGLRESNGNRFSFLQHRETCGRSLLKAADPSLSHFLSPKQCFQKVPVKMQIPKLIAWRFSKGGSGELVLAGLGCLHTI